jgi:hypothetical protein
MRAVCPLTAGLLVLLGILSARPGLAQHDESEILEALRARSSQFDQVHIDFEWLQCRAWLKDDPFDPETWHLDAGSSVLRECSISIVRPHFRLHVRSPIAGEDDTVKTWIDGQRTSVHRSPEGRHSVYIDDDGRWPLCGPIPYFTPFELQTCDVQESLLEMLEAGALHVEHSSGEEVILAGYPTTDPAPVQWEIRAVLDPRRGYVPVELHADIEYGWRRPHIHWTVGTTKTVPLRDIEIIGEAVLALDTSADPERWQIYQYRLTGLRCDDALVKKELAVTIPRKNTWLIDATKGYIRETDEQGRTIGEKQLSASEMVRRREARARSRQIRGDAAVEMRDRRAAFSVIVPASLGAVVVVVGGIWLWWRRRRLHAV